LKAVVQRVTSASVRIDGEVVSAIGPGMLVLLGVGRGDGAEQVERMARKLLRLRIFPDDAGRMSEVLCVSQFTLYGDTSKGNRPGFSAAAAPEVAESVYLEVCERTGARRGVFGADMEVDMAGDGPVTLLVEV
jgi:D-tyrosyl-tRNA(Tyr) deacylase